MSEKLLRYWCNRRLYVLPEDGVPYDGAVDGFRLREETEPSDGNRGPDDAVDYRIIAERPVTSRDEVLKVSGTMFDLADDLDRLWIYVTAEPLFYLRLTLDMSGAPDNWETNAEEVKHELYREESGPTLGGSMSITNVSWRGMPFYPLKEALSIRPDLHSAEDRLTHLITLHHEALTTTGIHAQLLMFAKAIELARKMVEVAWEKNLPNATGRDMRRGFRWLWKMSNRRIDTRHVVDPDGKLLGELTRDERRDFKHDADLVLRDLVCSRFGRQPFRVQSGRPDKS